MTRQEWGTRGLFPFWLRWVAAASLLFTGWPGNAAESLPDDARRQLPAGFDVMTSATLSAGGRRFLLVALAASVEGEGKARNRPLLIFERKPNGTEVLLGRNDHVILRRDDGGLNQCDPFEDGRIAVKGSYFTVEQGVACGQHWTYYVTFRFDRGMRDFVFDNLRVENWEMSGDDNPLADALISEGPTVERAKGPFVRFSMWRPRR